MKIELRFFLIFLSLMICTCPDIDTGFTISQNIFPDTGSIYTAMNSNKLNPFGIDEYLLRVTPTTSIPASVLPATTADDGYYTFLFTLVRIEPVTVLPAKALAFTLTLLCDTTPKATYTAAVTTNYRTEIVDLTVSTLGKADRYVRKSFFASKKFQCTLGAAQSITVTLAVPVAGIDNTSHLFLIKQMALVHHACDYNCATCVSASSAADRTNCKSCMSGFTLSGSTCACTRMPPYYTLLPKSNEFQCKELSLSYVPPCTAWEPSASSYDFDYCTSCGGESAVAQYLQMPFTYKASPNTLYTDPQQICKCPVGKPYEYPFEFTCKTLTPFICSQNQVTSAVSMLAASKYLSDISTNLVMSVAAHSTTAVPDIATLPPLSFADVYKMTFTLLKMEYAKLYSSLSFRAFYKLKIGAGPTYTYRVVEVDIPQIDDYATSAATQPTAKDLYINLSNLSEIDNCAKKTEASPKVLWICKIQLVAYNPCTNLKYMEGYIPLEIGDGYISTSAIVIGDPIALNYPCLNDNRCYINKDYTIATTICTDSICTATKANNHFAIGEIIWIRAVVTKSDATTPTTSLEYATFEVYNSYERLIGTIDVKDKATKIGTTTVYGFPIELPGDVLENDLHTDGKMKLAMTFKITSRRLRMLDDSDSDKYAITPSASLTIQIVANPGNSETTTAIIVVCTLLGAAIVGVAVYCLLRKKKIEEKKPLQQDVKISSTVNTGNANLYSEREHQIKEEDQRI